MNIIRYSNRKLYNVDASRYIVYPDLLNHIRSGGVITVLCKTTRMDITDVILRKCVEYNNNTLTEDLYAIIRK